MGACDSQIVWLKIPGTQVGEVEKVFAAASHKKVWDHFSKAQRKNIEIWKKQSSEIRTLQLEDFLQETGGNEEMDCSDEEESSRKNNIDDGKLQEENDNLKCQVEAYKNEMEIMRSETMHEMDSKIMSIESLKTRIAVLENQLTQAKKNQTAESVKLRIMEAKMRASQTEKKDEENKDEKPEREFTNRYVESGEKTDLKTLDLTEDLTDKEAKLIGITSTFLHVHPMGASTDYLWSYVHKMEPDIRQNQLEELLCRFPTVFVQNMSGVGANIERKWVFNGFAGAEA